MPTHFITFLGRAPAAPGGGLGEEPKRRYRFPGGRCSAPRRLFARAALEELAAGGRPADRILVLGTAGSMWDVLLSELVDGVDATELWTTLHEQVEAHTATQEQAGRVAVELWAKLDRPVECRVVPAGAGAHEQLAVLSAMAAVVQPGDHLLLDLTHRYRHLPLAGLLSASLIAYDRECTLLDVWYADQRATEGEPPAAPVISLAPLLQLQDWSRAFAVLRESGRFAPMAGLLGDHPAAHPLEDTGFFLATNQVPEGRRSGLRAAKALAHDGSDDPLLAIVRDDLRASLDWVDEPRIWDRMLTVARRALAAGDHLEAVTLTLEALYWAAAAAFWGGEKPQHSGGLAALKRRITGELRHRKGDVARFHLLRKLRNAAAHGLKPAGRWAGEVRRILSSAREYRRELSALIEWVDAVAERWNGR